MAKKDEKTIPTTPPALTTPCGLPALRAWLAAVDVLTPGYGTHVTVTSTATALTVA